MTDEDQHYTLHEHPDSQTNRTQLRYPQLLIEASFESLLSHSHSSGSPTVTDLPSTKMSLSESWSSLSENDLSHDDDLHSEATDTGSLIDISTADDIHSVNDHGNASDEEEDHDNEEEEGYNRSEETREREQDRQPLFRASGEAYETSTKSFSHSSADSRQYITLDDSVVRTSTEGLQVLQASKTFTDDELRSSSIQTLPWEDSDKLIGLINMTMSTEHFQLGQKPFHILYHGPELSPPEIKSDVLGKVGAALMASGFQHEFGEQSETPCFHIVPSEFGPGSRPSTADLIPIPVQMHVSDCVVLEAKPEPAPDSSIRLQIGAGTMILSRPARFYEIGSKQQWTLPDLAVIVVSQTESENDRLEASRVLEFSRRHNIGNICLRHGSGWNGDTFLADSSPDMLHEHVEHRVQGKCAGYEGRKMLVDVETFLDLDSEQLNCHLQYLVSSAKVRAHVHQAASGRLGRKIFDACRQATTPFLKYLPGCLPDIENTDCQGWALEVESAHASHPEISSKHEKKLIVSDTVRGQWPVLRLMYRVILTLLLTALTAFTMYSCSTAMPRIFSGSSIASQNTDTGKADISVLPGHSPPPLPITSTTIAATSQTHALSGPLQVLEQQVHNWMPLQSFKDKKAARYVDSRTKSGSRNLAAATKNCQSIVPAHLSPSIKVDQSFFSDKGPLFMYRVEREGESVSAKLEKKSRAGAVIKIKRKDSHGRLTVYLQIGTEVICANIDLENSVSEAFTLWNNSFRKQKFKSARRLGNEYTPLLEVRKAEQGIIHSALEIHHSAAKGLGAAIEAVEKSAIKHAKTCYQNNEQCLIPKIRVSKQDLSESAQQFKQKSLALIHYAQEQISTSAKQVKERANEMTDKATGEVSRAVQVVQSSWGGLSLLSRDLPRRVTGTLAKAQKSAQKVIQKPRIGRGE